MTEAIQCINFSLAVIFVICYFYQFVYILISLFKKPVRFAPSEQNKRYAFMISARNEDNVIKNLIDSIKAQTYPSELLDIYICADNCTDNTAAVAKQAGAVVYSRTDPENIGKGWALDFLFKKVRQLKGDDYYDAFFIFDADNLLDKDYVARMNDAFSAGHRVIAAYRNTKNFGTNWLSCGYGLWFLHDSRHLNNVRMILGSSCSVAGTGFLISNQVIKENDGWPYHLLIEDIQFSTESILKGEKIAYCDDAKFYDEQPEEFKDSWNQRMRWTKGYMQILRQYGKGLIKGIFSKKGLACYDMLMTIMPAIVVTVLSIIANVVSFVLCLISQSGLLAMLLSLGLTFVGSYLLLLTVGALACATEWEHIRCADKKKVIACFLFPLFVYTFIPVVVCALFRKVEWKPIRHKDSSTIEDMEKIKN